MQSGSFCPKHEHVDRPISTEYEILGLQRRPVRDLTLSEDRFRLVPSSDTPTIFVMSRSRCLRPSRDAFALDEEPFGGSDGLLKHIADLLHDANGTPGVLVELMFSVVGVNPSERVIGLEPLNLMVYAKGNIPFLVTPVAVVVLGIPGEWYRSDRARCVKPEDMLGSIKHRDGERGEIKKNGKDA